MTTTLPDWQVENCGIGRRVEPLCHNVHTVVSVVCSHALPRSEHPMTPCGCVYSPWFVYIITTCTRVMTEQSTHSGIAKQVTQHTICSGCCLVMSHFRITHHKAQMDSTTTVVGTVTFIMSSSLIIFPSLLACIVIACLAVLFWSRACRNTWPHASAGQLQSVGLDRQGFQRRIIRRSKYSAYMIVVLSVVTLIFLCYKKINFVEWWEIVVYTVGRGTCQPWRFLSYLHVIPSWSWSFDSEIHGV